MANIPTEADRLHAAGRNKILRSCLLFGIPLLAILVATGLQYAGVIHLEEYFAEDPNKIDPRLIWQALAMLGLPQFLFMAIGVLQGWGALRRARQLRKQ
jgi:hypothetical protein